MDTLELESAGIHGWWAKKKIIFSQKAVIGSFYFFLRLAGKIHAKTLVKKSQTRPVENEKKIQGMGVLTSRYQ